MIKEKTIKYGVCEDSLIFSKMDQAIKYKLFELSNNGYTEGDVISIYSNEVKKSKASDYLPNIVSLMKHKANSHTWLNGKKAINNELQELIQNVVDDWANRYSLHPDIFIEKEVTKLRIELKKCGKWEYSKNQED